MSKDELQFLISCGFSTPRIADFAGMSEPEVKTILKRYRLTMPYGQKLKGGHETSLAGLPDYELGRAKRYPVYRADDPPEEHGPVRVLVENGKRVNRTIRRTA